jgi:hypothetical protein
MNVSGVVRNGTAARLTRQVLLGMATTLVLTAAACGQDEGVQETAPSITPTVDAVRLGIFEPFAGRIVYDRRCITEVCPSTGSEELEIWGIDPFATDRAPTRLPEQLGTPAGWSRDGTELLVISPEGGLIILHADGTETLLRGPMLPQGSGLIDAAISPDGSRVAYAATTADGRASRLFAIDVESGRSMLLVEPSTLMVYQPSFSPNGTQVAYMDGWGDHNHSVWVVDADGSDPHRIVKNEVTWGSPGHVFGLSWSPTGDRIALGLRVQPSAGIYTFAPDGSGFTRLISDGLAPSWSPDGSQIAYDSYVMDPCSESSDTCWRPDMSGGLVVADADGSDARSFGVGGSGPWHPAE